MAPRFRALLLAALVALPAVLVAQDHAHHHVGLPELRPIPEGALATAADVQFYQGMIAHHGQAIHMSHLAETRAADPRLVRFAQKIDQSQIAEIALMQDWLRQNGQVAPDSSAYHDITMPGMLTREQLAELASLRGPAFDRRFLELMIVHHEGAIGMVADLFKTPRAAQDIDVNVMANDIHLVQTAEIDLMRQMLSTLPGD
jgi:uncharacterized protein (DUF305 family)